MSDKDSGPGFGIGLILGIAVGAAIGFLFAPRSGKEMREMVKSKAAGASATVKDLTADRRKVYTETWKRGRGQPKVKPTYFE
ncbi:MAG: YtxH domain-containing protein [Dehalococcoidia bacterium]|nr:YtxH domain-containing protein [Dehalococcoidia bacterium]